MPVTIDARWRVDASTTLRVPLPAPIVWGQMRDWRRFITLDPLHRRVTMRSRGGSSPRGARFVIRHELFGIGVDREARMLTWREGRGYAFSDLSPTRLRRAFPHICAYTLVPRGPEECDLVFTARGVWTARFTPRFVARFWLLWVIASTRACIGAELNAFALWRAKRARLDSPRASVHSHTS